MEFKLVELGSLNYGTKIRSSANERLFNELKASIRAKGIKFPLVAVKDGDKYMVIDGVRRLNACRDLGWNQREKLPVILVKADEGEAVETALIANTVRGNFSAVNMAEAVNLLVNKYKKSIAEMASSLGTSFCAPKLLLLKPVLACALSRGATLSGWSLICDWKIST